MKKSEVLLLYRSLNQLGALSGAKFSYAIAKNINILKGEVEALDKALEPDEKFQEFEKQRVALLEKYAEKDDTGKPKKEGTEGGSEQYVMGDNLKRFEKEFEVLKKDHKDAVDARDVQIEEYTKLLETDIEINLHRLKMEDVPETITTRQLAGIYEIIDDK